MNGYDWSTPLVSDETTSGVFRKARVVAGHFVKKSGILLLDVYVSKCHTSSNAVHVGILNHIESLTPNWKLQYIQLFDSALFPLKK